MRGAPGWAVGVLAASMPLGLLGVAVTLAVILPLAAVVTGSLLFG